MTSSPRHLRALLAALSPAQRSKLLLSLDPKTQLAALHDWELWARDNQLAPSGAWSTWLLLAGRGFGKTRTGAEWINGRVRAGYRHIALVAPTSADARDVMVEGPAGILRCSHPSERPLYESSKRRLTWPSGATATLFSAEEPERLRGPQHDTAWCDELGAWKYAQDAWDNLQFGLRLSLNPQACVTTTPRPIPLVKELLLDPTTSTTRGSTFDNASNLARRFLDKIKRRYEGTRLGRQELFAELLEDTPGALWTLRLLESHRVRHAPELVRVVVAVDPAASSGEGSAETGIVGAGRSQDRQGYVLDDRTLRGTPAEWGEAAVLLYDDLKADAIVGEVNNGGEMVGAVVKSAAEKLFRDKRRPTSHVNFRSVHASRGKATRAEPISALDEQGRVHHVGVLAKLEDQMATWVPGIGDSPDRVDARVWALTELLLEEIAVPEPEELDVFNS